MPQFIAPLWYHGKMDVMGLPFLPFISPTRAATTLPQSVKALQGPQIGHSDYEGES